MAMLSVVLTQWEFRCDLALCPFLFALLSARNTLPLRIPSLPRLITEHVITFASVSQQWHSGQLQTAVMSMEEVIWR